MSNQTSFFAGVCSIGKSQRSFDLSHKEEIPGPGSYDVSLIFAKNKAPQWKLSPKIGRSKSSHEVKKLNEPSPFSYNLKSSIGTAAPKFTFGVKASEKKSNSFHSNFYNPRYPSKIATPSFSFGYKESSISFEKKEKLVQNLNNNVESPQKDSDPSKKIKNLKKSKEKNKNILHLKKNKKSLSTEKLRENYPGPGSYQPNYVNMLDGPKIRFAASLREDFYNLKDKNNLGPGSFEIKREFDNITSKSKEKKVIDDDPQKNSSNISNSHSHHYSNIPKVIGPGPALYNPDKIRSKIGIKFKTAARKDLGKIEKIPGPGAYTPEVYKIIKASKFSTSEKSASYINNYYESPGPGEYSINEKIYRSALNVVMKQPLEKSLSYRPKQNFSPGPSDYNPNYDFLLKKKTDGTHFSKYERFAGSNKSMTTEKESNQGPSLYLIEDKFSGPHYSFSKKDKTKENSSLMKMLLPGPGSYEIKSTIAILPNYLK